MNSKLNMLLRFGLSVGLQDREAFVEKVSSLLQDKMGTDEMDGQAIGEKVLKVLESFKEELVIDQIISGSTKENKKIEEEVSDLKKIIAELSEKIDKNFK